MIQRHGDGIRLQAGSKKFRTRCLCCLHDLISRAAKRTPELLQDAMNQAAENRHNRSSNLGIVGC